MDARSSGWLPNRQLYFDGDRPKRRKTTRNLIEKNWAPALTASVTARTRMAHHKFKVGQTVNLIANRLERHVPSGAYTIQRLLPIEGQELLYRVKHTGDGHERVVNEAQLRPGKTLTPHH
jgi:hypothetical protein